MKNPKLEAAQRRLFNGRTVLPNNPWPREFYSGIKPPKLDGKYTEEEICAAFKVPTRTERLQAEVNALQELLNEKDEQIDRLQRPMVVRLDWWAVGLVVLVVGAQYLGFM